MNDKFDLLKSHIAAYTRKDGAVVAAHDDARAAAVPKPGEVGHDEHQKYGAYFKKGDQVKDRYGKTHEVADHSGPVVRTTGGESFHPTKVFKVEQAAKTGSAAPARMVNAGTAKWPMQVKSSDKLAAKHADGSTHHVGGFEAPSDGKGDHIIHHDGKTFSHTGKSGTNSKTGEKSFEYSHEGDDGESRAWVSKSGHLTND